MKWDTLVGGSWISFIVGLNSGLNFATDQINLHFLTFAVNNFHNLLPSTRKITRSNFYGLVSAPKSIDTVCSYVRPLQFTREH